MPIVATDLVRYSPASVPEDDTSTSGGAIDLTSRPEITQFGANAVAAIVSDGADTRSVTVTGRNAAGAIVSDVLVANGTTEVVGAITFERIHKIVTTTSATRTITVRQGAGGATVATIAVNEIKRHINFQQSSSAATQKIRYEKIFWRNNHATLALSGAQVTLTADPVARIRIGLATATADTVSVANRLTAPGSVVFVDDSVAQNVPGGGNLAAVTAIGVWIEQTLAINDTAQRSTYTTQLSGTTV